MTSVIFLVETRSLVFKKTYQINLIFLNKYGIIYKLLCQIPSKNNKTSLKYPSKSLHPEKMFFNSKNISLNQTNVCIVIQSKKNLFNFRGETHVKISKNR